MTHSLKKRIYIFPGPFLNPSLLYPTGLSRLTQLFQAFVIHFTFLLSIFQNGQKTCKCQTGIATLVTFSFQIMQLKSFIKDNGSICLNSLLTCGEGLILWHINEFQTELLMFPCTYLMFVHVWILLIIWECDTKGAPMFVGSLRLLYAIVSETLSSKHQYSAPPLFCHSYVKNVIFCALFSHLWCHFDVKALVFLLWCERW